MSINEIDDIFDKTLDKFNIFLKSNNIFSKITKDNNFVKYHMIIINVIKKFTKEFFFLDLKKKFKDNFEQIFIIIKRYCAFYIFLGIGFFYKGNRDLFITNILEVSKTQKDPTFEIQNFFNSDNNSKIIKFYTDIKNILELNKFKTIERIKIVLKNEPIVYNTTIEIFNELGEDYIIKNFLIKDNFHNIIKTFIFRFIYLNEEKTDIIDLLNYIEKKNSIYKYIEIVQSSSNKIADFSVLESLVDLLGLNKKMATDFYNFLEINKQEKLNIKTLDDEIRFLFDNKILVPITEDILRFHKKKLKYNENLNESIKSRDATKIKYILNKVNIVKNVYSDISKKNPKLKLKALEYMYKPLENRNAIIYNDDEELKIIKKLEESDLSTDIDLLVDLENIRKYCLINYNNFSKDGIKLRTNKTIRAIRSSCLKNDKNSKIELRIGNSNIDMNVIGVAFNPSKFPLDCFSIKNLKNIKENSEDNGYKLFLNKIKKSFFNKEKVIYYWLFDTSTDIVEIDEYRNISSLDISKNIKIMLSELFKNYKSLVKIKFLNYIKNLKEISIWNINNLLKKYEYFFDLNFDPELRKTLISYSLTNKLVERDITEDKFESYIPGKFDKLIELPKLNIKREENKMLVIEDDIDENINIIDDNSICYHYIKWDEIRRIPSKKSDIQNQEIFNFVKQYVKTDIRGSYVCKSCGELLNIKKYVFEGTYIPELDEFLTTSLAVNQNLNDIPKYSKFTRTIRNIEKNIEKICYYLELNYYIGNDSITRLHRKMIIKDVIDLILIHSEYLKNEPKNRVMLASQKYNINKDMTNLWFFSLKDEIFLTDSTETDYYKIIKFNNVLAYIILIIITELNSGQILNLKNDKKCNYFIYSKVKETLFKDIYIRISLKEKILISKFPLLEYIIYYISCILTNNYIWLWTDDKKGKNYLVQNVIIHTVIDLINTIIEANLNKDKNYLYEIIGARIINKLNTIYNDEQLFERVKNKGLATIRIDTKTKKIKIVKSKINMIDIKKDYVSIDLEQNYSIYCDNELHKLNKNVFNKFNNNISFLTNCDDGKFHEWEFNDNNLVCKLCKKNYRDVLKNFESSTINDNKKIIDKILYSYLKKLSKVYCVTGELHEIDSKTNKCNKCKIDPDNFNYTFKILKELNSNLNNKLDERRLININVLREKNKLYIQNIKKSKDKINKFEKYYNKNINKSFDNYIKDFLDKLKKYVGDKIKSNNNEFHLFETKYIIDHDVYGNKTKKEIVLKTSDNKVMFEKNNKIFNKDVYFYKDNSKKVTVYYDAVTKQYIGYGNNKINIVRSDAFLEIKYSVYDMIKFLGLENEYTNILHLDYNLDILDSDKLNKLKNKLIEKNIRNRVNRLIFIVKKVRSIIENINNNTKKMSLYNDREVNLINRFSKILNKFKTKNDEGKEFMHNIDLFTKKIKIDRIPENININISKNKYIDNKNLLNLKNYDSKLIFYILENMLKLIDFNNRPAIRTNIILLIVNLIKYLFDFYYISNNVVEIRKFDYILHIEEPDIDERSYGIGIYQELLSQEEIDDPERKEQEYDAQEAFDSLDIDDYEINDDIDNSMEALN
jgi:hypothetical protein